MIRSSIPLILALGLWAGAAGAQEAAEGDAAQATEDAAAAGAEQMMSGEGHDMGAMGGMTMSEDPAMKPFMDAMHGMMMGMPTQSTGDVDADFLLLMIPHHQSAIDMARVVLEQGDDEETRAMAQAIIDAQEAEIAEMQAMLERLGQGGAATEGAAPEGEAPSE